MKFICRICFVLLILLTFGFVGSMETAETAMLTVKYGLSAAMCIALAYVALLLGDE